MKCGFDEALRLIRLHARLVLLPSLLRRVAGGGRSRLVVCGTRCSARRESSRDTEDRDAVAPAAPRRDPRMHCEPHPRSVSVRVRGQSFRRLRGSFATTVPAASLRSGLVQPHIDRSRRRLVESSASGLRTRRRERSLSSRYRMPDEGSSARQAGVPCPPRRGPPYPGAL